MQILLTQEEYESLTTQARNASVEITEFQLQGLCSRLATLEMMSRGISCVNGRPRGNFAYCDDCPCRNECPSKDKEFSK